ncbi:MAG: hypothetical protein HY900_35450 [Deltaproteobacteria bacterium]|nr:hypothetical protein [Deltaproteobacteria bacterium]
MQTKPDVMIIDTDRSRIRSLRRIVLDGRSELTVDEVADPHGAREAILGRRP